MAVASASGVETALVVARGAGALACVVSVTVVSMAEAVVAGVGAVEYVA